MNTIKKHSFFTQQLLYWNEKDNTRQMPWKGEKDPYKIWLSEIILQQTRVNQGWAYYIKFIDKFPTIKMLADAPEQVVFKSWEGLGYYSRCLNMIHTARFISMKLNGIFPNDYESILSLKGIGPYTAAAIASFAYNLPHAVVDGNVIRVLARFYGITDVPASSYGKVIFAELAIKLLDKNKPGLYNQAIMDFGAVICKPQSPLCSQCVVSEYCIAYNTNAVNEYPVKSEPLKKKNRWFCYIIAEYKNEFLIKKRIEKDIWQNLYEFILIENKSALSSEEIISSSCFGKIAAKDFQIADISPSYKQQLTHQTIIGFFIHIKLKKRVFLKGYQYVKKGSLFKFPFPGFINEYLHARTDFRE